MSRFTDVELDVMRILWEQGELKPAEIIAHFPRPIKNSAVRSFLSVLVRKGHVARRKQGKAFYYKAKTQSEPALNSLLRRTVDVFFKGSTEALLCRLKDHWIAAWHSKRRYLTTHFDNGATTITNIGIDADILFSYSSDNGATWSEPYYANSWAPQDHQVSISDTQKDWDFYNGDGHDHYTYHYSERWDYNDSDLYPAVAWDGSGQWRIFWHSDRGTGIDPAKRFYKIYYSTTTQAMIENSISPATPDLKGWRLSPWSEAQALCHQTMNDFPMGVAQYHTLLDMPLEVVANGKGNWLLNWSTMDICRKPDSTTFTMTMVKPHVLISRDNAASWTVGDMAAFIFYCEPDYYSIRPFYGEQETWQAPYKTPATAMDDRGEFMLAWSKDRSVPSRMLPMRVDWDLKQLVARFYFGSGYDPRTGSGGSIWYDDTDIVNRRTPNLWTADYDPNVFPIPTPEPTPVPPPPPVVVTYDKVTTTSLNPGTIVGKSRSFPTPEDNDLYRSVPWSGLGAVSDGNYWKVDGSGNDGNGVASVAVFHLPVLDGSLPGIHAIRNIFSLDLTFSGGRLNTSNNLSADYSAWVFLGGIYGPDQWNNPDAWEQVTAPGKWPRRWAGYTTATVTLDNNFNKYLNTTSDTVKFGGDLGSARPVGTLTWAVCSKNVTGGVPPAKLMLDYVKVAVHPAPASPAPATADPLEAVTSTDLTTSTLVFYADLSRLGLPSDTVNTWIGDAPDASWTGKGRVRLTLNPAAHTLSYAVRLLDGVPGMRLRLAGYAIARQPKNPYDMTYDLCTLTTTSAVTYTGSWDYGTSFTTPQARMDFESNLTSSSVFAEIRYKAGPNDNAIGRGQFYPDWDGDGLSDREEAALGTDRLSRDTDGDGLLDGEEARCLSLLAWTRKLNPSAENPQGSNPLKVDTDGDALADSLEVGMTTATLDGRIGSWNKTIAWNGRATETHTICGTTATLEHGIHAASGLHLIDTDPSTVTDPSDPDTDNDGFWDGPTVWVDLGADGLILRAGEDKNGDGKYDALGADGAFESIDDETDPNNRLSLQPENIILALDEDRNGLPDEFEDFAGEVADALNNYFSDDRDQVIADVIADAQEAFDGPNAMNGQSGVFSSSSTVVMQNLGFFRKKANEIRF